MNAFAKYFIALTAALPTYLCANSAVVTGTVTDSELGEGEPYAVVQLYKGDNTSGSPLSSFTTDLDGNFSSEITKKGQYTITFSSIGKQPVSIALEITDAPTLSLGTIKLAPAPTMLNEVEVVAQKPLVKMTADKVSYNMAEDTDSKTNTLLDMLRKLPMVAVDGDDNITVNGSGNFKVYVDGRPSMMFSQNPSQIFKSMPASAVQSVEVVVNPGAQYDAEGAGGVINLVMDKKMGGPGMSTDGVMGTVSARGGLNGGDASLFLSGGKDKVSFSANVMHSDMVPGKSNMEQELTQGETTTTTRTKGSPRMNFTMGNFSGTYTPDTLTTIELNAGLHRFGMKTHTDLFTSVTGAQGLLTDYSGVGKMDMSRLGVNGGVTFGRRFTDRFHSNLSLLYQISYEHSDNNTANFYTPSSASFFAPANRTSVNKENTTEHVVQADYNMVPREGQTFEAGAKMAWRSAGSDATFAEAGTADALTRYHNNNRIGALYASYALQAGITNLRAGLRYEHTWQSIRYDAGVGSDFSKNYGFVVPSASISLPLSETSNLGLTYNMRIQRPGISYMNPYHDYSDPTSVTYGNDRLNVEKSHNVGLSYGLTTQKLTLTARLTESYTPNGIERYSFYQDGLLNNTYGNIVKRNNLSLNIFANWMVGSKTRLNLNGTVTRVDLKSDLAGYSNHGWQGNFMAGVQQQLPWNIKGNVFLMYSTKRKTLQGWNTGFSMLALNLSRSFVNDRLTVSAGFRTGLHKNGDNIMGSYSHSADFTNHSTTRVPSMTFNIGVSFTFGSIRAARMNNKTRDNDFIESKSDMEQFNGDMQQ